MKFSYSASKIPNRWSKVSVSQLIRLLKVQESEQTALLLAYVSILTNPHYAANYPVKKVGKLKKRLSFISRLPHRGTSKGFFFKWRKYVNKDFESLTVAEYVDLELALIEHKGIDSIPYVLGILFKPIWQRGYSGTKSIKRGEFFANLPADIGYRQFLAFINWRDRLLNQRFKVLFNSGSSDEDGPDPINRGGRRHKELQIQLALRKQRWNWYGLVHRLAGGDILKMESVERLPIVQAFVLMAYELEGQQKNE